jgi:hypothetical protein
VVEDDARVAGAEPRAGLHEFAAAKRHELAAHEPRNAWPGDGGDGDDFAADRGGENGDDQQRKNEGRNGLEEFRDAHQRVLGLAAIIAGQPTDNSAEDDGGQRRADTDDERGARAVGDLGCDVAAERVGAEQEAPARRLQGGSGELEGIIGVDHRRQHDEQEKAQQHHGAEERHPVACEPRETRPHVKPPCAGRA